VRVEPSVAAEPSGRIDRRMPRMQVYLPDELYRLVKKRRLPASELLQNAVRAELRRRELIAEADEYVKQLASEVGEPTAPQRLRARALTREIVGRERGKAG
jgi:post-segregation antitoxin (ccd killing protein)